MWWRSQAVATRWRSKSRARLVLTGLSAVRYPSHLRSVGFRPHPNGSRRSARLLRALPSSAIRESPPNRRSLSPQLPRQARRGLRRPAGRCEPLPQASRTVQEQVGNNHRHAQGGHATWVTGPPNSHAVTSASSLILGRCRETLPALCGRLFEAPDRVDMR